MVSQFVFDLGFLAGIGLGIVCLGFFWLIAKAELLSRKRMCVYGATLVLCSAVMLTGFQYNLSQIEFWLPHTQPDLDRWLLVYGKMFIAIMMVVIPFVYASIGSSLIYRAITFDTKIGLSKQNI